VILALLLGCGLRRQELAQLKVEDIVEREGRAVIVDLVGKGRRVRTVAVPYWVKQSVKQWTSAAGITKGLCFGRSRNRASWANLHSGTGAMVGGRKLRQALPQIWRGS
jgi:integrase